MGECSGSSNYNSLKSDVKVRYVKKIQCSDLSLIDDPYSSENKVKFSSDMSFWLLIKYGHIFILHLLYQQTQYIHTRTTFVISCSWVTHLTPLLSVTGSAEWARTVKIRASQIDDHCGSRPLVVAVTCPTSLQLP